MRSQRTRQTAQEQIASLMLEDFGSNLGQDPNAGPSYTPSDPPSVVRVTDAVGGDRHTEMRQCSAEGCANNLRGRSCGLAAVEINQEGGCSSYEARGDSRYEDHDEPDEDQETIIGISAMMPSEVDVPSQRGRTSGMFGNFNNGTMT